MTASVFSLFPHPFFHCFLLLLKMHISNILSIIIISIYIASMHVLSLTSLLPASAFALHQCKTLEASLSCCLLSWCVLRAVRAGAHHLHRHTDLQLWGEHTRCPSPSVSTDLQSLTESEGWLRGVSASYMMIDTLDEPVLGLSAVGHGCCSENVVIGPIHSQNVFWLAAVQESRVPSWDRVQDL